MNVIRRAESRGRSTILALSALFLLPGWFYIAYLAFGIPIIARRNPSENLFAVINVAASVLLIPGWIPLLRHWLGGWMWALLYAAPLAIFMIVVFIEMPD